MHLSGHSVPEFSFPGLFPYWKHRQLEHFLLPPTTPSPFTPPSFRFQFCQADFLYLQSLDWVPPPGVYLLVLASTTWYCNSMPSCLSPWYYILHPGVEISVGLIHHMHPEYSRNEEVNKVHRACAFSLFLMCTSWLSFSCLFPVEISCLYHFSASRWGIYWLPCFWPLLNQRVKETKSNIWNELLPCQPSYWANWGQHFYPDLPVLILW